MNNTTETLNELLEAGQYTTALGIINDMNPVDVAEVFENLGDSTAIRFFRMLPKNTAAEIFAYFSTDVQQRIISMIKDNEIKHIIDEMFLDDAVDFIEEMPASVVKRVLASIPTDKRELINQFLNYPANSVGSIMTIEYISLKENLSVQEAFMRIRSVGIDSETIYTCYVTDAARRLLGEISVKTLLLAAPESRIGDIMTRDAICAVTTDDREQLANSFRKYGLLAMPVVDHESRIVGIVTVDDIMNIQEEEATEDFEIMAAMSPSEEPYLKAGIFTLVKNRLPWLLLLMITAAITGTIITSFEESLAAVPALISFIPMLMNTGGNSGSQSSTITIRGMALEEITTSDLLRVWWKEIRIAVVCGAALSIVNFGKIMLFNRSVMLALTVSIALYCTVILSKSLGCLLPMAAKRLKLDPAVMASPAITTIVDAGSLLLLLTLSKLLLDI